MLQIGICRVYKCSESLWLVTVLNVLMAVGVLLKLHMWQIGVWRFHEDIEFQEGNQMCHVEVLGML